ncbi:UNKNOWN [Stylonychia lemnae]|uniref:Uncharacterized protein n=1 Tax=Stylonychia lemnae TaxID=5949 RepID=A0A078AKH0_STYLE|nr:UNKNOWN [Stylonychia lemnae]|eukprot:CDW81323.1 UNKNOWN [Stylonychia lemnae]
MTTRINFFNLSDDKLVYDERKKRFVFLQDAPAVVTRNYQNSQFKEQRPDLSGEELFEFRLKLKIGSQFLRQMNYQTKLEMRRLWRTMGGMSFQYYQPLLDDFMTYFAIDRPRTLRLWTWDDSTRIVNFLTVHLMRAKKYGLDIPHHTTPYMTKELAKQREDELTEFFITEMRKAPSSALKQ